MLPVDVSALSYRVAIANDLSASPGDGRGGIVTDCPLLAGILEIISVCFLWWQQCSTVGHVVPQG
jgi:hypothetical protein